MIASARARNLLIPVAIAVVVGFGLGMVAGVLRAPPVPQLLSMVRPEHIGAVDAGGAAYAGDRELLRFAFTDPLIDGQLIHPPIVDLAGVGRAVESMLLPVKGFSDAYRRLQVIEAGLLPDRAEDRVLAVRYRLAGRGYAAHAYVRPPHVGEGRRAALVIPGSGHNQSSGIYREDEDNYHHGLIAALEPEHDVFILIKPNEDVLAFHDGTGKLNPNFYLARLINAGGSYSAHYVANALAVIRHLETAYPEVVLSGLSQGGLATLLAALQAEPYAAIIASGYSTLEVTWAGFDQLLIPGMEKLVEPGRVRDRLEELRTRFLFTFGKSEVGTYRIEAESGITCGYLAPLDAVQCEAHEGGHIFPADRVREFLNTQ
jgi:hypothetical protein